MSYKQVLAVLDKLSFNQQDVAEYIKSFNGDPGFLYADEVDLQRMVLQAKMNKLDDGSHSGASWGWMMRKVQDILNGVKSYEEIVIIKNRHEEQYMQWLAEDQKRQEEIKAQAPEQE